MRVEGRDLWWVEQNGKWNFVKNLVESDQNTLKMKLKNKIENETQNKMENEQSKLPLNI